MIEYVDSGNSWNCTARIAKQCAAYGAGTEGSEDDRNVIARVGNALREWLERDKNKGGESGLVTKPNGRRTV